jgi:hypothetical protein
MPLKNWQADLAETTQRFLEAETARPSSIALTQGKKACRRETAARVAELISADPDRAATVAFGWLHRRCSLCRLCNFPPA